ncbi:MAG: HAD hydrolase family protein [Candidatus Riflebacteria bacterium]|nr:HAD hydrolase family protein [Candidatus Riflebacteria bacterium]
MIAEIPKYFIFDVDGVLTTGQFLYSEKGKEFKVFGAHDNDGIKLISKRVKIAFLTADKHGFSISKRRIVDDMKQELFLIDEDGRLAFIEKKFGLQSVIYMGDGFYDAPILEKCFYGIAPKNARIEARKAADFVTPSKAGEGAVLDACLHVMKKFFAKPEKGLVKCSDRD